ncbi:hypothetical protein BLA29_008484 [Euroglyphus maynei]|uniref:Uncharacterized protein n=1 Tax=Euroglyphus maynei TaxID=6958 RepID=A0A1Y3BK51_EURMA|nr:hypothetical protein BLA29_008484 [Euroglyphus maynei]
MGKTRQLSSLTTTRLNIDQEAGYVQQQQSDDKIINRQSLPLQSSNEYEQTILQSSFDPNPKPNDNAVMKSNGGDSHSLKADIEYIDNDGDGDDGKHNNSVKSNGKSIKQRKQCFNERTNRHFHHHHRQRRHNKLYNSYSSDHCCSITKLDRKIDPKSSSPHHRQMSSDPNINMALNLYNQNHHHHHCRKLDSSTMTKKPKNSSFDV